jgi:hypothetical protein
MWVVRLGVLLVLGTGLGAAAARAMAPGRGWAGDACRCAQAGVNPKH